MVRIFQNPLTRLAVAALTVSNSLPVQANMVRQKSNFSPAPVDRFIAQDKEDSPHCGPLKFGPKFRPGRAVDFYVNNGDRNVFDPLPPESKACANISLQTAADVATGLNYRDTNYSFILSPEPRNPNKPSSLEQAAWACINNFSRNPDVLKTKPWMMEYRSEEDNYKTARFRCFLSNVRDRLAK